MPSMTVALFIMGLLAGAFVGALAVALAVAADRRDYHAPDEPGRVHLYPPGSAGAYRLHRLYPGQVLNVRGALIGTPPNESAEWSKSVFGESA